MAAPPFLDANLILRHVLQDLPDQSARATAFILRIEEREIRVRTADAVIFEVVFTLERTYKVPRPKIRDTIWPVLALPSVVLPGKRRYRRIFELYVGYPRLSFADCSYVALMERLGITEIISFDRGFDGLPAIIRAEPDTRGSIQ
jgi:predicted nucleic acid-binding protein